MEVVNFCSLQLNVAHSFVDCRNGISRITIAGFQSLVNFMGVDALLLEKFDDISLFDSPHIDIINVQNVDKYAVPAETSRLSSIALN
jgi:hypothetical protein